MISNNGHAPAFNVTPGTLPAIVHDAGGRLDSPQWDKVAPVLAEGTGSMIITHDHTGQGKSNDLPCPWLVKDAPPLTRTLRIPWPRELQYVPVDMAQSQPAGTEEHFVWQPPIRSSDTCTLQGISGFTTRHTHSLAGRSGLRPRYFPGRRAGSAASAASRVRRGFGRLMQVGLPQRPVPEARNLPPGAI